MRGRGKRRRDLLRVAIVELGGDIARHAVMQLRRAVARPLRSPG